jgi:hypothetical protein
MPEIHKHDTEEMRIDTAGAGGLLHRIVDNEYRQAVR